MSHDMPSAESIQRALYLRRLQELVRDGYLLKDQSDTVRLTLKGMAVLMACADRPIKGQRLPKTKEGNDGKQS